MEKKDKFQVQVLSHSGSIDGLAISEIIECDSYEITDYGVYKFYERIDGSNKLFLSTPAQSTILRRMN